MISVRAHSVKSYTRREMRSYAYIKAHEELARELAEEVRICRLLKAMDRELTQIIRRDAQ